MNILCDKCHSKVPLLETFSVGMRTLKTDTPVFQINRISKGGYFGELALVTHKPRAASAYAVGNIKLACEYK
jgi:CRP-like cAMP-binding protein